MITLAHLLGIIAGLAFLAWLGWLIFFGWIRARIEEQLQPEPEPPYPWCSQPHICRHKGYCPRDPNCGE